MAIFHLHGQMIKRSAGRSAVACAAYRSGETLYDERLGKVFDYTRKHDVEESVILGPKGMPEWLRDREALWNAVEAAERTNGQPAREFDLALPIELVRANPRAAKELVTEWAFDMFVVHGLIADIAFHDMQSGNPHVHVLVTTRPLRSDACEFQEASHHVFGKKARHLNDRVNMDIWRWNWACAVNETLEVHGIDARIDHRSLAAQGITDREPGIHVGPEATAMWLERGIESDRWERNAIIWWQNEREWFEENARYVAFLDAEAAEERALDEQARSELAQREAFDDLAHRFLATRETALSGRRELLKRVGQRGHAAVTSSVSTQNAKVGEASAGLQREAADMLRPAITKFAAVGARLSHAAAGVDAAVQDRLEHSAQALGRLARRRWHQECHHLRGLSDRLDVVGKRLALAATRKHEQLTGDRQRLASWTERLDDSISGVLEAKELQSTRVGSRLSSAPPRLRELEQRLAALTSRAARTLDVSERSSRLATNADRMTRAVESALRYDRARLQSMAERLDERRPSLMTAVAGAARERIRSAAQGASSVVMIATGPARRAGQLAKSAANTLLASLRRAGAQVAAPPRAWEGEERVPMRETIAAHEGKPECDSEKTSEADVAQGHVAHTLALLEIFAMQGYLPVRRVDNRLSLHVEALPRHLSSIAGFSDHPRVRELLERDEGRRTEEMILFLGNAKEPVLSKGDRGAIVANLELFPPQLRPHVAAMIGSDPLLLEYARDFVKRQAAPAQTTPPCSPQTQALATQRRGPSEKAPAGADPYEVARAFHASEKGRGR